MRIISSSQEVEVLFDDEFMGGTTLGGLCKRFAGARLPMSWLVNITYGLRRAVSDEEYHLMNACKIIPLSQDAMIKRIDIASKQQDSSSQLRDNTLNGDVANFIPPHKSTIQPAPTQAKTHTKVTSQSSQEMQQVSGKLQGKPQPPRYDKLDSPAALRIHKGEEGITTEPLHLQQNNDSNNEDETTVSEPTIHLVLVF